MSSKVLLVCSLCLLSAWCWGDRRPRSSRDISSELEDASEDLQQDASIWQSWKPGNMFNFKQDSQRTLTRRESSLIADKTFSEGYDTGRSTRSTTKLQSESITSVARPPRPPGSVRRELVTMMFESMLGCIVDSWDVITPAIPEDINTADITKSPSELTSLSKKSKKGGKDLGPSSGKHSKTKRGRNSKSEISESQEITNQCWWSAPDERAVIRFKNGNMYEGNISMKCMNGEGRFQWTDGTVYLGQFKDNAMHGKGLIQWKDDTWYEGEFMGNLRHGRGLYVNSRQQAFYSGGWHSGAKHGKGLLHFPSSKNNSYDGDWILNVRHGHGAREYSHQSGYKGQWEWYVNEGKGLMIWPNHDLYMGDWQNGVMSGYGTYIWDAACNNTMSVPSMSMYRGLWHKGERNGYGILLCLGSNYKGNFRNNKKHGKGKIVTNTGLMLQSSSLFVDDILGPVPHQNDKSLLNTVTPPVDVEPLHFNICDDTGGLTYHIQQALKYVDIEVEIRMNIINAYIANNTRQKPNVSITGKELEGSVLNHGALMLEDTMQFEEQSLRKSLRNYEIDLKNIYYQYATICNTEAIYFQPIMIRLYLWQFYYDCNVNELGLSLIEIDKLFHACPEWLSQKPHDPFEKIYFWQFIHSLLTVANKLYNKRKLPGARPDTILASAFRTFMENDALPGSGKRRGFLVNGFGCFVPLKGAYELYQLIGEPHTVRQFICATRHPPHYQDPQPALEDSPDDATPIGRNVYMFETHMTYVTDDRIPVCNEKHEDDEFRKALKLFNFGNLSSSFIIKTFSNIFPQLCRGDKIMDLEIEITFYEFFEAFIACCKKSIRIKEEEMRWKEKFFVSNYELPAVPNPTPAATTKSHKHL